MKKNLFIIVLFFLSFASNSFAMQYDGTEEKFREFFSEEFSKYIARFMSDSSIDEIKKIVKTKFVPFKGDFTEGSSGEFWLEAEHVPILLSMFRDFLKKDVLISNFRVGFKIVDEKNLIFIYDNTAVKVKNVNLENTEDEDLGGIQAICPCVIF